ncbi:unnamed protein product [Pseudo-nitzschia multistriata]|uniref:Uncharacterized protein n=1 Tax=Pseudo-nitzschia multistriata TaxID=183589 RepID=A0A448ZM41_9STRA|nr:unnamed protein product [Pseudo-nitzschia multistriata]
MDLDLDPAATETHHRPFHRTVLTHEILYAVQRCPHPSGSGQAPSFPPVDMLRLFRSQREAEEVAYHSALAEDRLHGSDHDSGTKTLLLPSYPALNPNGSSYGFCTQSGALFWVRALKATMVAANGGGRASCRSEVCAVLTGGVIGGQGQQACTRRGAEVPEGRVFGGDAAALAMAGGVAGAVAGEAMDPCGVVVKTLPVGRPPRSRFAESWYSSGAFLGDWPQEVHAKGSWCGAPGVPPCHADAPKRHSCGGAGTVKGQTPDGKENECPCLWTPVAKRRRLVSVSTEDETEAGEGGSDAWMVVP